MKGEKIYLSSQFQGCLWGRCDRTEPGEDKSPRTMTYFLKLGSPPQMPSHYDSMKALTHSLDQNPQDLIVSGTPSQTYLEAYHKSH